MGTGRLFWQAVGRSVEDGEVWCRFQQDDQGGGDHGDGGGGHEIKLGVGLEHDVCIQFNPKMGLVL